MPRQDDGDVVTPIRPITPRRGPGDVVPFDQRPVYDVDVAPHMPPARELRSEDDE